MRRSSSSAPSSSRMAELLTLSLRESPAALRMKLISAILFFRSLPKLMTWGDGRTSKSSGPPFGSALSSSRRTSAERRKQTPYDEQHKCSLVTLAWTQVTGAPSWSRAWGRSTIAIAWFCPWRQAGELGFPLVWAHLLQERPSGSGCLISCCVTKHGHSSFAGRNAECCSTSEWFSLVNHRILVYLFLCFVFVMLVSWFCNAWSLISAESFPSEAKRCHCWGLKQLKMVPKSKYGSAIFSIDLISFYIYTYMYI